MDLKNWGQDMARQKNARKVKTYLHDEGGVGRDKRVEAFRSVTEVRRNNHSRVLPNFHPKDSLLRFIVRSPLLWTLFRTSNNTAECYGAIKCCSTGCSAATRPLANVHNCTVKNGEQGSTWSKPLMTEPAPSLNLSGSPPMSEFLSRVFAIIIPVAARRNRGCHVNNGDSKAKRKTL